MLAALGREQVRHKTAKHWLLIRRLAIRKD
jgi:hypothetical protein